MENPVRTLRENLGLNQHQFGELIGRSYASVQGYEAGKKVPPEIVSRMKTIAAERGYADIAVSLTSDDWQVQRVIHPTGHTVHHSHRDQQHDAQDDRDLWHGILDRVWDAGHPESIGAVKQVLLLAQSKRQPVAEPHADPKKSKRETA